MTSGDQEPRITRIGRIRLNSLRALHEPFHPFHPSDPWFFTNLYEAAAPWTPPSPSAITRHMPGTDPRRVAYSSVGVLIAAMFVLQGGAAFAKNLFPLVGPEGGSTLRLAWASLLLCVVWRPWRHRFTSHQWFWLCVYGLCVGGMNLLIYKAVDRIPLGVAVAVEFTGPLAVAVLGSRRLLDLVWVLLAAAGLALLMPWSAFGQPLDRIGLLYALAAGACWGVYIVAGKRVAHSAPGGIVTAIGMTIGLALALPFGIATAGSKLLSWEAIRIAVLVSLLSSIIPYSLEIVALRNLPARTFGVLMALEPVIASMMGAMILWEWLTPIQWAAMALIIGASVGSTVTSAIPAPGPIDATDQDPEPALPI
jgi:inner membrane transporter RhtA